MKLIIPADSKNLQSTVCQSFGRTLYYALYDSETNTTEFIDNAAANSAGGAGIRAAQMIVDRGAIAIITFRCGVNAAQVLNAAGIKLYMAVNGSIQENIDLFNKGQLNLLTNIHPGFHNHGNGGNGNGMGNGNRI